MLVRWSCPRLPRLRDVATRRLTPARRCAPLPGLRPAVQRPDLPRLCGAFVVAARPSPLPAADPDRPVEAQAEGSSVDLDPRLGGAERSGLGQAGAHGASDGVWLSRRRAGGLSHHGRRHDRRRNRPPRARRDRRAEGIGRLYHDDGEMQDTTMPPSIDWMRDPVKDIEQALREEK